MDTYDAEQDFAAMVVDGLLADLSPGLGGRRSFEVQPFEDFLAEAFVDRPDVIAHAVHRLRCELSGVDEKQAALATFERLAERMGIDLSDC